MFVGVIGFTILFLLPISGHHLANRSISSGLVLASANQVLFANMSAQRNRSLINDHRLTIFGQVAAQSAVTEKYRLFRMID